MRHFSDRHGALTGLTSARRIFLGTLLVFSLLAFTGCPKGTAQKLATASDAFAHSLRTAQKAVQLGLKEGTISPSESDSIEVYFVRVAQAGKTLDAAIRANGSNSSVGAALQGVLQAMASLTTQGVLGVKNPVKQQEISIALNGAADALAIVAATVGVPATPAGP